ncbi:MULTISPECIES: LysE family translocator [Photorhabdus]|uniref:LysE family transporter n=1 Tax=Photorhabdus kayaii TaxID=230088 RepID=A0ABX0B5N4_9GAMM|nr:MULTISPECIES: LysE family translocator [Photorhabdus]MCC8373456.1 LysE family translocator [Photorhabdus bodei]MCT8353435.1 LysE family translocator [Photorhabdus kayaii]MDB6369692.1 LysE family translocator [Photorhabdus bodei]NDL13040.1 LysE family transporter [Photorhabdus kayaii]NDL26568.1 LysE family transporter [Photorhabdus kayaii]
MVGVISTLGTFFILGLGAAAPVGPINIEIMRRHLNISCLHAVIFGLGACFADIIYLLLLGFGILQLFSNTIFMPIFGFLGALMVIWFGITSFINKKNEENINIISKPYHRQFFDGVLLTLLNPYNVIFWLSVSAQLNNITSGKYSLAIGAAGTIIGVIVWVAFINTVIFFSRKMFSHRVIKFINYTSGIILIMLGIYFFSYSITLFNLKFS